MTEQRDRAVAALADLLDFGDSRENSTTAAEIVDALDANPEAAAALRAYLGVDGLDAAWAEAEAALPEGWGLASIVRAAGEAGQWRVWAGDLRSLGYDEQFITWADGPTPVAALLRLAARLADPKGATE